MTIDPVEVRYIQFPEFRDSQRILPRPKTRHLAGDWDVPVDTTVYWCSVYEPALATNRGMVPLGCYKFYTALEMHFLAGQPWKSTEWYQWMVERQQSQPVRRYQNAAAVQVRLDMLDRLYAEFSAGNYQDDRIDRPIINIGRNGRIALEDGRHRLCVARIAGVRNILVDVNVIHADVVQPLGFR